MRLIGTRRLPGGATSWAPYAKLPNNATLHIPPTLSDDVLSPNCPRSWRSAYLRPARGRERLTPADHRLAAGPSQPCPAAGTWRPASTLLL